MSAAGRNRTILEVVRHLRGVTRDMLEAAKKIEVQRLQELGERRAEVLFELEVLLASNPARPQEPDALRTEFLELRELEDRLSRVGSLVVRAIAQAAPGPAKTYGRAGRVTRA